MKAAVLHAPHQPLTIEDVEHREAEAARGAGAHRLRRAVPQRPAFHGGAVSASRRPACSATRSPAVVEAVGEDVTYVKPGDHVITCLSVFCGDCAQCMTGHPNLCENTEVKMLPGVAAAADLEGRASLNQFAQPLLLRRADAGARERGGEDRRRHPARPRGAGRLRRDDRRRRGVQRRQGRAGHRPSR